MTSHVKIEDFIDKEMVHYSFESNLRGLPSLVDGLKISHRKILYTCFNKNVRSEIKLLQLGGAVIELTQYHHGEDALHNAIVKMAQDFVGSNNIPLLEPCGQFGTRHEGGKDYASPRYISTKLSRITRYIFPAIDDRILEYREEDGLVVEPLHYYPIVPLLLINGSRGIGTGWSTDIPCYHPIQICERIKKKLRYVFLLLSHRMITKLICNLFTTCSVFCSMSISITIMVEGKISLN